MADVHSKKVRSYNMRMIRGKNTKPEVIVRKYLFSQGFRFRIHDESLPGKPDIVLKKFNTVIFVNGCFWHMHKGCKYFQMPSNNRNYWSPKLNTNVRKDRLAIKKLRASNMNVIVIWECQLKGAHAAHALHSISNSLTANLYKPIRLP